VEVDQLVAMSFQQMLPVAKPVTVEFPLLQMLQVVTDLIVVHPFQPLQLVVMPLPDQLSCQPLPQAVELAIVVH